MTLCHFLTSRSHTTLIFCLAHNRAPVVRSLFVKVQLKSLMHPTCSMKCQLAMTCKILFIVILKLHFSMFISSAYSQFMTHLNLNICLWCILILHGKSAEIVQLLRTFLVNGRVQHNQ